MPGLMKPLRFLNGHLLRFNDRPVHFVLAHEIEVSFHTCDLHRSDRSSLVIMVVSKTAISSAKGTFSKTSNHWPSNLVWIQWT